MDKVLAGAFAKAVFFGLLLVAFVAFVGAFLISAVVLRNRLGARWGRCIVTTFFAKLLCWPILLPATAFLVMNPVGRTIKGLEWPRGSASFVALLVAAPVLLSVTWVMDFLIIQNEFQRDYAADFRRIAVHTSGWSVGVLCLLYSALMLLNLLG